MYGRSTLVMCSAVIFSIVAFSATPSLAQKTAKACEDEWKAGKATIQASGKKKKDFIAECRTGTAAPAAAKPATPPTAATPAAAPPAAVAPAPAAKSSPAATAKATDGKQAETARIKACGAEWKADKAAGKTAGLTWPKYWSDCNKRKKAAGM
jgi:hypothetical protein